PPSARGPCGRLARDGPAQCGSGPRRAAWLAYGSRGRRGLVGVGLTALDPRSGRGQVSPALTGLTRLKPTSRARATASLESLVDGGRHDGPGHDAPDGGFRY